jgi:hypothetical protein
MYSSKQFQKLCKFVIDVCFLMCKIMQMILKLGKLVICMYFIYYGKGSFHLECEKLLRQTMFHIVKVLLLGHYILWNEGIITTLLSLIVKGFYEVR